MMSLQKRGLLSRGDYFVIGIDIEQYDPAKPEKYLRGLLLEDVEPLAVQAFQSYLAIVPTASVSFATFANEVCLMTGHDSAVIDVLDSGGRPRNGSAIVAAIKGSRYRSAMGWVLSHLTANPQLMLYFIFQLSRLYR